MADDQPAAYLAEVRDRSERPLGPSFMALSVTNDAVRWLMESAADVPHLCAALEAVLRLADAWESNAPEVPLLGREAAACAVRGVVLATLQDTGVIPVPLLGESGASSG